MEENIKSGSSKFRSLFYVAAIGYACVTLFPFLWSLYTSFKTTPDMDVLWVPFSHLTFTNYSYILTQFPFGRWFLNSFIVAIGVTLGNVIVNTLTGYALARIKFPGNQFLFIVILGVMMIPGQVTLVPTYILLAKLGWINSFSGLIIPFLANPFMIFFMRQFFLGIPRELEEAGRIDGLSRWGIFLRIVLPLTRNAIATQVIFTFQGNWNSFLWPVLLTSSDDMYTLPVGLNSFYNQYNAYWNSTLAGVMMLTLPILLVFVIFQKQFIKGVATTGIK